MHSGVLINQIDDWLIERAIGNSEVQTVVEGCVERLFGAGIRVARMHISYRTLHPLFSYQSITWTRDTGLEVEDHAHQSSDLTHGGWDGSPLKYMVENQLPTMLRRLDGADELLDFPILEEFASRGMTDYLAFAIAFDDWGPGALPTADGMVVSWTSDRDGGFCNSELEILIRVQGQHQGAYYRPHPFNISRPRCRATSPQRTNSTRRLRAHSCGYLVQRHAPIHGTR